MMRHVLTPSYLLSFLETTGTACMVVDPELRIVAANQAYADYHDRDASWFPGRPVDALGEAFNARIRPALLEALSGQEVLVEGVSPTGVPVEVHLVPMRDEHGQIIGVADHVRDISARVAVRSAKHLAEAQLRSTLDAMAEGIVVFDPDGVIIEVNEAAEHILGRVATRPGWRTLQPDGRPFLPEDLPAARTLATGEPVSNVLVGIEREDADIAWVRISARPVQRQDGTLDRVVVSLYDLTRERAREVALQQALEDTRVARDEIALGQRRLQTVLDTVNEAIITMGIDSRISSFNRAAEQLFGWTEAEVMGRDVSLLMPPLHRRQHESYVERHVTTGEKRVIGIGRYVVGQRKDGTRMPLRLSVSRTDFQGQVLFTGVLTDLSHEEELEQRLMQQQKMEAIGAMAGGFAHDFNNILHGATLAVELARRELDSQTNLLEPVATMLQRGHKVVQQLLTFSRKDEALRASELAPEVEEILALCRVSLPARHAVVLGKLQTVSVGLSCAQLHQLLLNLLLNASHALGPQSGSVWIDAELTQLDVPRPPLATGEYVLITVRDDGPGIPAEDLPHIFEPFFTTKPEGEGSGLGLAMVQGLVLRACGMVEASNAEGGGATFRIWLPVVEPDEARPEQVEEGQEPLGAPRVVVIDDEPLLAGLGARLVRAAGGEATSFSSPVEALQAILASPESFDLVFTDLNMPGLSGVELADALKERGIGLPVVLTTGRLDLPATPDNIVTVLGKPFGETELVEALRLALHHK